MRLLHLAVQPRKHTQIWMKLLIRCSWSLLLCNGIHVTILCQVHFGTGIKLCRLCKMLQILWSCLRWLQILKFRRINLFRVIRKETWVDACIETPIFLVGVGSGHSAAFRIRTSFHLLCLENLAIWSCFMWWTRKWLMKIVNQLVLRKAADCSWKVLSEWRKELFSFC